MKKSFGLVLIIVAIIALAIWAFSVFVQPVLPDKINSSLVLFFAILVGVVGFLVKIKEITEFIHSLFENYDKNTESSSPKSNIIQSIRERVKFLNDVDEHSDADKIEEKVNDLIKFIEKLQQGDYFTKKIRDLTHRPRRLMSYLGEDPEKVRRLTEEFNQAYLKQLVSVKSDIFSLVEELIKLQ